MVKAKGDGMSKSKTDKPRKGDIETRDWTRKEIKIAGCVCSCGSKNLVVRDYCTFTDSQGGRKFERRSVMCTDCRSSQEHSRDGQGNAVIKNGKCYTHSQLIDERGVDGWFDHISRNACI